MKQFDTEKSRKFEERTSRFGLDVIRLCKLIRVSVINRRIIDQLIRSTTSVGANYMEANAASSRKDFANKIFICKKEAQESIHWLKMLLETNPEYRDWVLELSDECHQLVLIFQKINSTLKLNRK